MVLWPYSQMLIEHNRFNECYMVHASDDQEHLDAAFFVPEDIYTEIFGNLEMLPSQ
jgi:hypothetical protein